MSPGWQWLCLDANVFKQLICHLAGNDFVLMPMYLNNLYNLAGSGFVLMAMYLNNLYNLAGSGFVLMPMYLNNLYVTWLAVVLS